MTEDESDYPNPSQSHSRSGKKHHVVVSKFNGPHNYIDEEIKIDSFKLSVSSVNSG